MTDDRSSVLARLDLPARAVERLDVYAGLLAKWNPRINLVAPGTLANLWTRHFLDSAQLLALAPDSARHWLDLGSGGGFPGLVIAILAAEARPHLRVTLVESDQRKAAFLRTVSRETSLGVQVLAERAESVSAQGADVISARALAPLDRLLALADRHLAPGGTALFPKGATHADEVRTALANWTFTLQNVASESNADAALLVIGDIARV